jgi:hypothetical protein
MEPAKKWASVSLVCAFIYTTASIFMLVLEAIGQSRASRFGLLSGMVVVGLFMAAHSLRRLLRVKPAADSD